MELLEDSEDIFSPTTSNGLNNLFGGQNSNQTDLKYQAPKKTFEEKPENKSVSISFFLRGAESWGTEL